MGPDELRRAFTRSSGASSDYDLNPGVILPPDRVLRPAAVLIAVQPSPNGAQVILTKRSSRLKHHPGQIAFPGGKLDKDDASLTAAALREAQEEIGLPLSAVEVLGSLPVHETVTNYTVTPILGHVRDSFEVRPEMGEVEEVFTVPLSFLLDLSNFRIEQRQWRGTTRGYYVVPYGPYYIWGATARMLRGLAERLVP